MSVILNASRRKFRLSRGFTLVELLVVIGIIGVLATLVLVQLGAARGRARDAKRISDISQVRSAVELYAEDHSNTYPTAISDANLGVYMANGKVPLDPTTGAAYGYAYSPAASPTKYQIWAELEQTSGAKPAALNSDADLNPVGWSGTSANGTTEACTSAANDCIYDLGQQ
ncbi:MAG TPA: type II secretion system protein [Candidatus Paceibacterota bacterium]|nr:type II secretion system protein [Candidatus Paceibacterota bacterium]